MLSHLPQELIELILSYLDVKSVLACALLSSSLVAPSQRLIFRKLVIRIPHPDSPDSDTEASFAAASHISRYVRDLKVHLNSEAESFASHNGMLASILPSFHHLQGLSIKGRFGWNDMTLPLQSAIHNLMTSTNLRSLKLNRIFDVPPSIIVQALTSLRTLGLYRVIIKPSETDVLDRPVALRTEKSFCEPYILTLNRSSI
ncbi:hypothetical protein B0H14DRAFT_223914 [Mycena olivaceomarginata]|nr:hypothetical protein B0H14DRAFT_223914 [Mycena olivaceomarginata]